MYLQMLGNNDFLAHVAYIFVSILSITVSPMFSSLELFALAYRIPIFNEVSCLGWAVYVLVNVRVEHFQLVFLLYCFHSLFSVAVFLIDVVAQVIHAIVSNPTRLLSTIFLGAIFMWAFMLLGVAFFFNDYVFNGNDQWGAVCHDFATCFG